MQFLNGKIKGVPITKEEADGNDAENDPEDLNIANENQFDEIGASDSGWKTWSENRYEAAREIAKNSADGDTINACYNEDFAKRLKKYLLPYVALWTGVMKPIFGRGSTIATSAAVESEFADVKGRMFKGELPMRVDRFVLKHLDCLDDKIKLASNESDVFPADRIEQPSEKTDVPNFEHASLPEIVSHSDISIAIDDQNACSTPNKTGRALKSNLRVVDELELSIPSAKASEKLVLSGRSDGDDSLKKSREPKSAKFSLSDQRYDDNYVEKSPEPKKTKLISSNQSDDDNYLEKSRETKSATLILSEQSDGDDYLIKSREPKSATFTLSDQSDDDNGLEKSREAKDPTFVTQDSSRDSSLVSTIYPIRNECVGDENIPAQNECNVRETWGGLEKNVRTTDNDEVPNPKRAKPSYLDKCPEWDYIKDSRVGRVPILKNGNTSGPVNMGDYQMNIRNTCAFDSMLQVVLSGVLGNRMYREKTNSSESPLLKLAHNIIDDKKLTAKHLKLRAEVLRDTAIFQIHKYTRKIKSLDAKCNAAHLSQILLRTEPSSSYSINCCCGYTNSKTSALLNININIIMRGGFQYMQHAIDEELKINRTCYNCREPVDNRTEHGSHLIVDTSVLTDKGYVIQSTTAHHTLGSIATTVTIREKSYILIGVIDFNENREHYVAYAPAGAYWYLYDDLLPTRKSVNPTTKITPHVIVYAICSDTDN